MIRTYLRSFHAVAENGGFTAASRVLNVGQPTLTTQVKALETQYGIELFHRIGRKVTLTDAGRDLFEMTVRITHLEEETHNLLSSYKGLMKGRLRIAAVGPFHATDMISDFKQTYPDVDITVMLGNSQWTIERLLKFEADVGVTAGVEANDRVDMIPYRTHSVVIFVNAEHPFFERSHISIKELDAQPLVLREKGSTTRMAFEAALKKKDVNIKPVLEIGSREGVWKAVERGLGIGVVADFEFVPHARLKMIEIDDMPIKTEYSVSYLSERRNSRLIHAFCDVALKRTF